jgi:uncharacterized protein (TIGR03437 family)
MFQISVRLFVAVLLGALPLFAQKAGTISTIAGSGTQGFAGDGRSAVLASLDTPVYLAVAPDGTLYIADQLNNRIRKVTPAGIISTIAGTGLARFDGDGGPATEASLNKPTGIAIDMAGNIWIADEGNKRIRKIDSAGFITTVAGNGLAFVGNCTNGPALEQSLFNPVRIAVDNSGGLYIADQSSNCIRKVVNGNMTTVAGTGQASFFGDDGPATQAALHSPTAVFVDSLGNLWITDQFNHRIRKVDTNNVITTIAGSGQVGFSGDGRSPILASLNYPGGLVVDTSGNLFFADDQNFRVRKVTAATNVISTVAGNGQPGFGGDLGPATASIAALNGPFGVALDPAGNLYIADSLNHRIRKVTAVAATNIPTFTGPSVTNAASFITGATPGGLTTIFGTNLSYGVTGIAVTDQSPWPTSLRGTSVLVDGTPAPIYSVVKLATEQVSFQMPYETAGKRSVDIVVKTPAGSSATLTIGLLAVQPGVFNTYIDSTCACVHNADFTLVTQANPVDTNATTPDYIAMFLTGLGKVSNPPATGATAPASPLSWADVVPSVTVGGVHADSTFYGLAPYFIGLYQINFQVPFGLPSGLTNVIVTSNGVASNTTKLWIK